MEKEVTVLVRETPFVILPKSIFRVKRNPLTEKTSNFRILVLIGFLYALAMTKEDKAQTSYSELRKILNLRTDSSITILLNVLEREGIIKERITHMELSQREDIILIHYSEIPNLPVFKGTRSDLIFKVPKVLFPLPLSPLSKAVYMYLCNLKNHDAKRIVESSLPKIRKSLRARNANIILALRELENNSLIKTWKTPKGRKVELLPVEGWNPKLFKKAIETFPHHPLLKTLTNKEHPLTNKEHPLTNKEHPLTNKEHPLTNKEHPLTNKEHPLTNKEHPKAAEPSCQLSSKQPLEDYILEDILEDYIEDTTTNNNNNGGGGKNNNIHDLEIYNKEKKVSSNAKDFKLDANENTTPPKKEEPYGSSNKNSGKIGVSEFSNSLKDQEPQGFAEKKSSKPSGSRVSLKEKIDEAELQKVKETLKASRRAIEELLRTNRLEVDEELYSPLKKVYGEEWKVIAGMYELMHKVYPKYGYSRKANSNYVGLLISFVLKDSDASFWHFYNIFKGAFGLRSASETARKYMDEPKLFKKLMAHLKEKLQDKPYLYKLLEASLLGIVKDHGGFKYVLCRDSISYKYLSKKFKDKKDNPFDEFLGKYGWEFALPGRSGFDERGTF